MTQQKPLVITIGRNFDEIRRASIIVAQEKGVTEQYQEILNKLLRAIDQMEVAERVLDYYRSNGGAEKLPKHLKRELAEKLNFSEKKIEQIVYGG